MRTYLTALLVCTALLTAGCTRSETEEVRRDAREAGDKAKREADNAARTAGRVAHKVTEETKDLAKTAGRKLKNASREAKEGWNEAKKDQVREKP